MKAIKFFYTDCLSYHTPVETCLDYSCDATLDEEVLECFFEFLSWFEIQIDCEEECPSFITRKEEVKDCF